MFSEHFHNMQGLCKPANGQGIIQFSNRLTKNCIGVELTTSFKSWSAPFLLITHSCVTKHLQTLSLKTKIGYYLSIFRGLTWLSGVVLTWGLSHSCSQVVTGLQALESLWTRCPPWLTPMA